MAAAKGAPRRPRKTTRKSAGTAPGVVAGPNGTMTVSRERMGWTGFNAPGGGAPWNTFYQDAAPVMTNGNGRTSVSFSLTSANREIVRERRQAVINARELDRNNSSMRSGITKRAVDMVGMNLRLQSMPNITALGLSQDWADEFAEDFENHFSLWGDDPRKLNDAARHSQFGAQMFEICRNTYGADGEAAMIIRYDEDRMNSYRGQYATFLEVLDPDRISNPDGAPDDETLCQGRELDPWGAYTGLYVERRHPNDNKGGVRKWDYVARETDMGRPVGVHWFPRYRAGAQRAMPAIISSMRDCRMFDTFDNKMLEKAILAAFMSIFIKTDATSAEALAKLSPAPATGTDPFVAMMNARFGLYEDLNVEGQSLPVLAPGDEIGIETADVGAEGFDSFRFAFDRKLASILGLSYARFSNDYSKTSFASIRAELIDAWRMTYADRYQFCSSVPSLAALALLEETILRKKIILPAGSPFFYDQMTAYAQCEFRGPGMGWVDPVKDAQGAGIRIISGLSNPQAEAAAQGSDFRDNIDATAAAMRYAERKKVKLTFGPAQTQTNIDEQVDANGDPIDPNAGTGGPGSSDPAPGGKPDPAPAPKKDKTK